MDGRINNPALSESLQSILNSDTGGLNYFQKALPALVAGGFVIGAIVFFFMLLIGGIRWIAASGDKAQTEAARGTVTSALIGIFILLSLFAIVALVETFFDVDILTLDIGALKIE